MITTLSSAYMGPCTTTSPAPLTPHTPHTSCPATGFAQGSLYSSLEDILTEGEVQKKEKWPIRIATKHLVKPGEQQGVHVSLSQEECSAASW